MTVKTGPAVIAIDGAAGSGKSTLGKGIALAIGLPYVNTGMMYRALTAAALKAGISIDDEGALVELTRDLRFSFRPDGLRSWRWRVGRRSRSSRQRSRWPSRPSPDTPASGR